MTPNPLNLLSALPHEIRRRYPASNEATEGKPDRAQGLGHRLRKGQLSPHLRRREGIANSRGKNPVETAPVRRRQVTYAQGRGVSIQRACAPLSVARTTLRYESRLVTRDVVPLMTPARSRQGTVRLRR